MFLGKNFIARFVSRGYEKIDAKIQDRSFAELRSFMEENRGNKTIAIFGACGYVGSYLTLYLRSAGYKVFAFDMDFHNLCDDSILSQIHFEENDIDRHPLFQNLTRNIDFVAIKRIFHAVRARIAC